MVLFLSAGGSVAGDVVYFRGARILTAENAIFDPGTLAVAEGKIVAVGPVAEVPVPNGAIVVDVSGKTIIPGLVDTHSHLGVYSRPSVDANSDGNEMTGPVQGMVRAIDAVNPFDPGIRMANSGGITTANIMPGSGNVIGGQTLYVKLRGKTPEEMQIRSEHVLGGLKMANGENPKRSYGRKGQAPGTRMKVAALQRSELLRAKDYQHKWMEFRRKDTAGEKADPPATDLALEPLVEVLEGRRTVHFHSHRADDILTTLRLREEFGFDLVIQHGTESYKVLDQIAASGVPVSMTILDSPGGKAEVVDFSESCGKMMHEKGIPVLINTDDPVTESRFFLRTASIAVRGGLPEDIALQAITIQGARAMRIDDRVGSLVAGKDADFVILSGEPFSVYTRVLQTYIDGAKVFDLDDDRDLRFQVGGFALRDASQAPPRLALVEQNPLRKVAVDRVEELGDATEFVILAGVLHTGAGRPVAQGVVHVKDAKVLYAGPTRGYQIPRNVPTVTATAVTPGLIDAHSVVPLSGEYNIDADQDQDEGSDPNQSDVRVLDGFHPAEPLLRYLLENGVTIVHACPGRKNVLAGQTGVFRTHGRTAEEMSIRVPFALLFNLGEAPKGSYAGRLPGTRMGTASLIRDQLNKARNQSAKRERLAEDAAPLDRDLKLEALEELLSGKMQALFCGQRADDLETALRLSEEFQLKPVLALAAEAYLLRDRLAERKVPVIAHPTMQRVGSLETYNSLLSNAAHLSDANVLVAIGSGVEGYVPKTRVVRHEAGVAMTYGLGYDRALRAVTFDAARILGIDGEYGSLEPGKIADVVLYDGDPFEYTTHVEKVIVGGQLVFDRANLPPIPLSQYFYRPSVEVPCCLGF